MQQRAIHEVSTETLQDKAKMVRRETVRLTDICGSGHYGSAFSIAELLAVLYYQLLHLRPQEPEWMGRDRFTMGKGHAAIGLYPILADLGFWPCPEKRDNELRVASEFIKELTFGLLRSFP